MKNRSARIFLILLAVVFTLGISAQAKNDSGDAGSLSVGTSPVESRGNPADLLFIGDATTAKAVKGIKVGETVRITGTDGMTAHIESKKGVKASVHLAFLKIDDPFFTDEAILPDYMNILGLSSKTEYLMWIDSSKQRVFIFSGKKGEWTLYKTLLCATGTGETPTVKGTFTLGDRGEYFISKSLNVACLYWVSFKGNYLFHSILYNTQRTQIVDARLGAQLSHGCVRLAVDDAKWVYDHMPRGTTVYSD